MVDGVVAKLSWKIPTFGTGYYKTKLIEASLFSDT